MKKVYFFIDDVIWLFRDLTRQRPKSIYENAFMSLLREAHDRYGMKVQLNIFLHTDLFYEKTKGNMKVIEDPATGLCFKRLATGPCLNLVPLEELEEEFLKKGIGSEYYGYATHEQYFYPEYFAYQKDYAEKILKAAEIVHRNGYEYFFAEELVQ